MRCEKLPQADTNMYALLCIIPFALLYGPYAPSIPRSESGLTYVLTPRETLEKLFSSFSLEVPENFSRSIDLSSAIQNNDTIHITFQLSTQAILPAFP